MSRDLNKMLKQAQKMQAQMVRAQEELKNKTVEGSAGGGMVRVIMNGAQELVEIKISPEVVDPAEVEMLEDLVVAAFGNAQEKVSEMSNSTMGNITAGLKMPGLM